MQETVEGLADTYAMLGRLPEAAREELAVELAIIAREIRDVQRRMVPKDTGHLEGGLSIAVEVERLRARIGLLALGYNGLGNYYYGRFVALGRHAQTVLVTRKSKLARTRALARARGHFSPSKRIRKSDGRPVGSPYTLRVRAMTGRDFVHVADAEDAALGQLVAFWSRTLKRVGAE